MTPLIEFWKHFLCWIDSRPLCYVIVILTETRSALYNSGGGVVVVQVFQNTIAVEAFTREAALIDALGCNNLTNQKPGDYYGPANQW